MSNTSVNMCLDVKCVSNTYLQDDRKTTNKMKILDTFTRI